MDTPGDLVSYLDNPKLFVGQQKLNNTSSSVVATLEKIVQFVELKKSSSFEACVKLAKEQFNNFFDY